MGAHLGQYTVQTGVHNRRILSVSKRYAAGARPFDDIQQNARLGHIAYSAQRPVILLGRVLSL